MSAWTYGVMAAGWLAWTVPFALKKRHLATPAKIDSRARWGMVLQGVAYSLLWQGKFWRQSPDDWKIALSIGCFGIASTFCSTALLTLGRQWRLDAGVNHDHELVRSGPYRIVRHPIYTGMLFLMLGTGVLITRWPMLLASLVVFGAGTEIRVRTEDKLLAERFGEAFEVYRGQVGAYLPRPSRRRSAGH